MKPAISVSALGKAFKRYHARWSRLAEWVFPPGGVRHQLVWILREIDFTVGTGEAMGIVGVNGAGKSTLLKLICGTLQPTTGQVFVHGRLAALLELGMGFHPQFTGRQNVVMAGQLLGLAAEEIAGLMQEIESFADIGPYIDEPLRIFSSGMQVRLAFAVATARRPEVLVIDEALSVGDAAFQRKCFRRIEEFRAAGTTLLFVSHSVETVKRLCDRALFIHAGRMHALGEAKEVCDEYEKVIFGGGRAHLAAATAPGLAPVARLDPALDASSIEMQYGDGGATILSVRLVDGTGRRVNVVPEGLPFAVVYEVRFARSVDGVRFGMMVKNAEGVCLYGTNTTSWTLKDSYAKGDEVEVRFDLEGNLVPGTYYLNVGVTHLTDEPSDFLHRRVDCLIFRIAGEHWRFSVGYANLFAVPQVRVPGSSVLTDGSTS